MTSLRLMQRAYNKYLSNEYCHFNLNQKLISLYSLEVNKDFGALLRLTETDDLVQQFTHTYQGRRFWVFLISHVS